KGANVTITLVSGVPLSLAGKTRTNEATVSSSTPDSDLTNNKSKATVKVTGAPRSKLQIRKSADPTAVALHSGNAPRVVFTIVLTVRSSIDAKDVDVCDRLPAGMTFVAAPSATFSNGRACWHLGVAKAHSSHQFTITAAVDKDFAGATLDNVVAATAGNADRVSDNATVDVGHTAGVANRKKHAGVTG